jgi:hypothetical protein
MAAAVIVRPGEDVVLPLASELIGNEEGPEEEGKTPASRRYEEQKQDGERKAAHRLQERHGEYYKTLKATVLGDDVYAGHNSFQSTKRPFGFQGVPRMVADYFSEPQIHQQAQIQKPLIGTDVGDVNGPGPVRRDSHFLFDQIMADFFLKCESRKT